MFKYMCVYIYIYMSNVVYPVTVKTKERYEGKYAIVPYFARETSIHSKSLRAWFTTVTGTSDPVAG